MTDAIETNLGRKPAQLSADAGYCSEANLEALESRSIDGYVATGRARDAVAGTVEGEDTAAPAEPGAVPTRVEVMRAKIKAGGHASPYRLRKQLPEPVFGQIKQARGFRQFLLRGFEKVRGEWAIVCTVHNLLKLARGQSVCTITDSRWSRIRIVTNTGMAVTHRQPYRPAWAASPGHDNLDRLLAQKNVVLVTARTAMRQQAWSP